MAGSWHSPAAGECQRIQTSLLSLAYRFPFARQEVRIGALGYAGSGRHDTIARRMPNFAKAHSRTKADELIGLGWTLRKEFYAEDDKEPYEYFFTWDHPGDPIYPSSYGPRLDRENSE